MDAGSVEGERILKAALSEVRYGFGDFKDNSLATACSKPPSETGEEARIEAMSGKNSQSHANCVQLVHMPNIIKVTSRNLRTAADCYMILH